MFKFRSRLFRRESLLQAIADDAPASDGGLSRISRVQNRNHPAVKKVQQALLVWSPDCLPRFGADGDFGSESAAAIHRFKLEELEVPAAEIIDDVGPRTVRRLDEIVAAAKKPTRVPPP